MKVLSVNSLLSASMLVGIVTSQNMNFTKKVSYTHRTVAASNLNPNSTIRKVYLADTTMDSKMDVVADGPTSLLSIRRNTTSLTSTTFMKSPINWSNWVSTIRGVESMGFIRDRPINTTRGWYILANSYDHISNSTSVTNRAPFGAVQMVRETGNVVEPIKTSITIPSTNYRSIHGNVNGRQVKVFDINNDGYDDFIVAIDGKNIQGQNVGILVLYYNNKNGEFNNPTVLSESLAGKIQFDIGDCDRNGYNDIAVIGIDNRHLTVFYQERNNTFTTKIIDTNLTIGTNFAITVGNFRNTSTVNNTFNSDIFIVGNNGIIGFLTTVLTLRVNQTRADVPDRAWALARTFTRNELFTFKNLQQTNVLSSTAAIKLSIDYRDYSIKLMDCDGDGINDIVTILGKLNGIKCFRKLPNDGMIDWYHDMINVTSPKSMDVVDINKDGIQDIIIHSETDKSIYLHIGKKL